VVHVRARVLTDPPGYPEVRLKYYCTVTTTEQLTSLSPSLLLPRKTAKFSSILFDINTLALSLSRSLVVLLSRDSKRIASRHLCGGRQQLSDDLAGDDDNLEEDKQHGALEVPGDETVAEELWTLRHRA